MIEVGGRRWEGNPSFKCLADRVDSHGPLPAPRSFVICTVELALAHS